MKSCKSKSAQEKTMFKFVHKPQALHVWPSRNDSTEKINAFLPLQFRFLSSLDMERGIPKAAPLTSDWPRCLLTAERRHFRYTASQGWVPCRQGKRGECRTVSSRLRQARRPTRTDVACLPARNHVVCPPRGGLSSGFCEGNKRALIGPTTMTFRGR